MAKKNRRDFRLEWLEDTYILLKKFDQPSTGDRALDVEIRANFGDWRRVPSPPPDITQYRVIISGIGTIYSGTEYQQAWKMFTQFRKNSKTGSGKAAGESIWLLTDGRITKEFVGQLQLTYPMRDA